MERVQHRHGGAEGSPLQEHVAWLEVTAALDWLPLPSLVLACDGMALGANEAWAALAAASAEAALGEGWLGVVDPLDRGPLRARLCEAAAVGQAGGADVRLAGVPGGRWSRWWWRPGPAGRLLVCMADLDQHQPHRDDPSRQVPPADLAGMVVHRLFGVGLTVQSAAGLADGLSLHRAGQAVAHQLWQAIDELDAIIRDVRTVAFKLHHPRHPQD